jgi:hypothetical protein
MTKAKDLEVYFNLYPEQPRISERIGIQQELLKKGWMRDQDLRV